MKIRVDGEEYTPQRIFCIGRNYAAHAAELDNEVPATPVIFLKPPHCLVGAGDDVRMPQHGSELHQEAELVLLIGRTGSPRSEAEAWQFVAGVSLGLDLTLRDVQLSLKAAGLPWELAKAFEQSSPVGEFVPLSALEDRDRIRFECRINGTSRQSGDTALMLFPVPRIVFQLGKVWELQAGDLIYTGTPAGVGPVYPGDSIEVSAPQIGTFAWTLKPSHPRR